MSIIRGVQKALKELAELAGQLDELRAENGRLSKRSHGLETEMKKLQVENDLHKQKIAYLLKKLFGAKSEKIDSNQLELLLAGMAASESEASAKGVEEKPMEPVRQRRKRTPRKDRFPKDLPEEWVVIDPPEVEAEPDEFTCIGSEELVELVVIPPRFIKRVIQRRKFVRKNARHRPPVIAPAPKRLIENSFASVELLIYIIMSKYMDHLPLYRQQKMFNRYGIELSRQTMSDWMWKVGDWLSLIYEEMKREIVGSGYVQVDETMIRYLEPGAGKAQQGYLWTYHSPGVGVLFDWQTTRSSRCLEEMLDEYHQIKLQCDGYIVYPAYRNGRAKSEEIILFGCWAHVRRKFFDAQEDSYFSRWMLLQIGHLYRVEARLREQGAGATLREVLRQSESRMVVERIGKALKRKLGSHLPKSPTAQAITYTLNLWEALVGYLRDGEVEIDNNLVENAIRPTALGKKNWLFFGSAKAGRRSAILYSILETCRKLGIDERDYLQDVLSRLPELSNQQIAECTPAKWMQHRTEKAA